MPYSSIVTYRKQKNGVHSLVIYYRHRGNPLRIPTGISAQKSQFNDKTGEVRMSDPEAKQKNERLKAKQENVEAAINRFIDKNGIKPSSDILKLILNHHGKEVINKVEANLSDRFEQFLKHKRAQFASPEFSEISIKDYISTLNALTDFQAVHGTVPIIYITSTEWLQKFNTFLASERPKIIGYRFRTRKQGDKTRAKRFSVLKSFASWLSEKNLLDNTDAIDKFKVKVKKKKHYALSLEELSIIQNADFNLPMQRKAVDMFIVACHTGLRVADIIRLRKSHIRTRGTIKLLEMNTQKTHERVTVPLSTKVIEILESYNYRVDLMSGQKANMHLKNALSTLELFQEEYGDGDDILRPIFTQISMHTGRRTFVTNLVNHNINLNAIMKMTGHKKISTLQQYINPDYQLMEENISIFNNL